MYLIVGLLIGFVTYGIYNLFNNSFNKNYGALFVNTCSDLNGKQFTYENIKHLKGYLMTSTDPLSEKTLNEYIAYTKSFDSNSNEKEMRHLELRPSHGDVKNIWVCWLTIKQDGTISTNALYTSDWASYQDTFIQYNSTLLDQ